MKIPKITWIKSLGILLVLVLPAIMISCKKTSKMNGSDSKSSDNVNEEIIMYNQADVFVTAHQTQYNLSKNTSAKFERIEQPKETEVAIHVNPKIKFQKLVGIGAAFTDAAAETFYKLPEDRQKEFIEAYFSTEKGIGYSLGRIPIHSCDFSSSSFTYVEEGDADLSTFSIAQDFNYRIPFIKKALSELGRPIPIYASPWSPPAFMKSNNNMLNGGKLLPDYYQPWANYYVKFIEAYENAGIPIWGLTIQNEPMAVQRWESCIYTAEEERDFVKNYLGPTLSKANMADKKLIVWDHNRDLLFQRADVILSDPEAAKYVWGTGFHWYEDWKDGKPMFEMVHKVKEAYPEKELVFTEGCNERYDLQRLENDDPKLAERYGKSMINDFNNGTVAWTDWNILLNEFGGPNHVGNYCFAPVHGNTSNGELTLTRSYYYIGHFSKFIRPGAQRLASASTSNAVLSTAFLNEDQSLAVVIMNIADTEINYTLNLESKALELSIPAHGIQTVVLR